MNSRHYIVLTLILATLGAFTFITFWEYYEEDLDLGWRSEAQLNPYLAAEIFLTNSGEQAISLDSIGALDDLNSVSTLFISNSNQVLSEPRLTALLDWLHYGGHLIIAAQPPSDLNNDRLLEYFDIGVVENNFVGNNLQTLLFAEFDDKQDTNAAQNRETRREVYREAIREANAELNQAEVLKELSTDERRARYEQSIDPDELTKLAFGDNEEVFRVHFYPGINLTHPHIEYEGADVPSGYKPFYWSGSNLSRQQLDPTNIDNYSKAQPNQNMTGLNTHFLQINVSEGLLTVISDPRVFDSSNIDKFDHAYLWQTLVGSGGLTAILYSTNMPSLGQILQQFAPEILLTITLLLSVWIWFSCRRFGPIQTIDTTTRRSIAEHIHASANFMWQGGWYDSMLQSLSAHIHLRAAQVIPNYDSISKTEQLQKLSQASGIENAQIQAAMEPTANMSEDSFAKTVHILQKIKNAL